jgi:hypothetical protein
MSLVLTWWASCIAADHFVAPTGGNVAPFISWDTAATNIQDAIDAASAGETVWVTNGVYTSGGKVMAGDLTNRVVLDKALTVQSVNGSLQTIIRGELDSATNGPAAARGAWLTNGAILSGFTIECGATRANGDPIALQSGGGVWGSSSNAIVSNCLLRANAAYYSGGGAYAATLVNCTVLGNVATTGNGGGTAGCNMTNCIVTGNYCYSGGGGAYRGILRNCAITRNVARSQGGGFCSTFTGGGILINCTVVSNAALANFAGGALFGILTNCIIYANRSGDPNGWSNYNSGTFSFCCTAPLPAGPGNISADPQVLSDGVHIAASSPCIGAGLPVSQGTDMDGQPWGTSPSIGCDEWLPAAIAAGAPEKVLVGMPPVLKLSSIGAGQEPLAYAWLKDGLPLQDGTKYSGASTSNLTVDAFGPTDGGAYQLLVSNAFGVSTSAVGIVAVHCANAASISSAAPYSDWATGATNIQDAIDAASPGDCLLVTNGIYATGGRVMSGDLTNRVAVNKNILVTSMSGPASTIIVGASDPVTTNGALSVRCGWLAQGATLQGLTLAGGATRSFGDVSNLLSGGGVWCASTNECLLSCIVSNNAAAYYGGGCYRGKLIRCVLVGNHGTYGGGALGSWLTNSLVRSNTASTGGGLQSCKYVNCTVTGNLAPYGAGGGEYSSVGWNSIVFYNYATEVYHQTDYNDWDSFSRFSFFSSWTPSDLDPSFNSKPSPQITFDGVHISATSPCRGAGNPLYASGTDIDGEPWANPPSMGCDEYNPADFTGPIFPGAITAYNALTHGPIVRKVIAWISTTLSGNPDRISWSFGDGVVVTTNFSLGIFHAWTNAGDFNVTFTAYNADNPAGVSTNAIIHVSLPDSPLISAAVSNGTNLVLSFPVQHGLTYVVEQATNLTPPVAWQSAASFYSYSGTAFTTNITSTNAAAFFRVRVP